MSNAVEQKLAEFFAVEQADTRRVFHGRGQLYEGLEHICVDWFSPCLLISAYAPVENLAEFVVAVEKLDKHGQIKSILLQNRYEKGAPAELLKGEPVDELIVREGGLNFEVHPGRRQNSGLFLDMRPLRRWLQSNSEGRNVLNLFAYTCSLSVAALAGGARSVTNVDMSKTSIKWGEKNHRLNGQDPRSVRSIPHNLFRSWGRIQQYGRYELVIIDPPTRQRGSFDVEKNYAAVIKKLPKLCLPGAEVIATLNSPFLAVDYLQQLFVRILPECEFLELMPASPEFEDKFPDKALKICRFRMSL